MHKIKYIHIISLILLILIQHEVKGQGLNNEFSCLKGNIVTVNQQDFTIIKKNNELITGDTIPYTKSYCEFLDSAKIRKLSYYIGGIHLSEEYFYGKSGRPDTIIMEDSKAVFVYDSLGNMVKIEVVDRSGNNSNTIIKYNYKNQIVERISFDSNGFSIPVNEFYYYKKSEFPYKILRICSADSSVQLIKYDRGGRIVKKEEVDNNQSVLYFFKYNARGDIRKQCIKDANQKFQNEKTKFLFKYDDKGNWVCKDPQNSYRLK
jgi:hypothetical protein